MSTEAVISSIMSCQISDSLEKINFLMSQVEESMSAVLSPVQFLPVISELLYKMQNVVSCVQQAPDGDDTIQSDDDQLWWDSSPELVAYCDIDEDSHTISTINFSSDCGSLSSISSESEQAIFIDSVLTFMSKVAPADVFSRQKSKRRKSRKMRRLIQSELFTIWYYSSQLMSDVIKKPAQVSPYPEVDWTCVNKRFLTNVPNPVQYPVHGCSNDEDFYETKYARSDYGYMTNKGSAFNKDAPFGSLPGYRTIFGVVSVPTNQVFHGYSWLENEGWVLHATMLSAPAKARRIEKMKRGRKRR